MWSHFIVLESPLLNEFPDFGQALEPMHVQALVPKLPVETLDESIVHWTPWCNEVKLNSSFVSPLIEVVTGEFSSVVRSDALGLAIPHHCLVKCARYRVCRESLSNLKAHAFPTHLVDGCEDSQPPSIRQLIAHEVDTPVFTGLDRWQRSQAALSRSLLASLCSNRQRFLPVDPVDSFVVHWPSFPLQQQGQPPVAVPGA